MKFSLLFCMLFSMPLWAYEYSGQLKAEDQKYYKNDSMEGNNQWDRINSLVKEVNKMYGDMAQMKAEIQTLRKEVDELKKKSP